VDVCQTQTSPSRPCAYISPGPAPASSPIMSMRSRGCSLPRSAPIALPSQPATPDANALPGQPALRPLAGGILVGTDQLLGGPCSRRPWSMRSPRERWSRASRSPRPTRGQGSQRCPCARVTAFTFCLKRSTAYGANGKQTLPYVDHERGAGPCRSRAGYTGRNRFGWNKSLSSRLGDQIRGSKVSTRNQWSGNRPVECSVSNAVFKYLEKAGITATLQMSPSCRRIQFPL